MGDMGDFWNDVKAASRRYREEVEHKRMESCKRSLLSKGFQVSSGPDHASFSVFGNGKHFNFWPYTGWFAGPTQGRGFKNLLKALGNAKA